jgi:hypothetical protein
MKRLRDRALVAYAIAASVFFVWKTVRPTGFPFTAMSPRFVDFLGFVGMFTPLLLGSLDAGAVAKRLERENRARPAWLLLAVWLAAFAVGEAVLGGYRYLAFLEPPTPSAGDAFFLLGYGALIVATVWFVRVYATSGLPLGPGGRLWLVALLTAAVLAGLGIPALAPVVHAERPLAESLIAIAYPVLDLIVLVPSAVLLAITRRFRGGGVWRVWALILSGFLVLSVADVLFAYFDLVGLAWVDPLLPATFTVGYTLTALGVATQRSLLEHRTG